MTEKNFSTQINDGFKRVAQEINSVRSELKSGLGSVTADAVATTDGKTVQQALDDLNYHAITISSLSCSAGTQELGSTVTAATISWKLSKAAKTATLDGSTVATTASASQELTGLSIKANKTFTLAVTDDRDAKATKGVSISFLNKVHWGKSTESSADNINSAFVLGLSNGALASNYVRDVTFNAAAGEFFYFACPASFGTPHFWSGGFEGGVSLVKTFDHTNASGYTTSYNVYRTNNAGLGNTTINIKA